MKRILVLAAVSALGCEPAAKTGVTVVAEEAKVFVAAEKAGAHELETMMARRAARRFAEEAATGSGATGVVLVSAAEGGADPLADFLALKKDYDALKQATPQGPQAKHLALAALIATLLKFLLDALQNLAPNMSGKAKMAIPWACMGLGLGIAVVSKYAGGADWATALVVGGSAPGAVLVHELTAAFRKKPATTTAESAEKLAVADAAKTEEKK